MDFGKETKLVILGYINGLDKIKNVKDIVKNVEKEM